MPDVLDLAGDLIDQARQLLGRRYADAYWEPHRTLHLRVLDLDDADRKALTALAASLGIGHRVRLEWADPEDVVRWDRLRRDLIRVVAEHPGAMGMYPSPEPGYRHPPVEIDLAPSASEEAAALHAAHGDFVRLKLGALPYPPKAGVSRPDWLDAREERQPVDHAKLVVELEAPLAVASGETVTHAVVVTNHSDHEVAVHTNGFLTADVVDARGATIGGFVGAQALPLVIFTVPPSGSVRIPAYVGTASFTPELGYAIPRGTWHLTVPLDLGDGRRLVSPSLEFTVTA